MNHEKWLKIKKQVIAHIWAMHTIVMNLNDEDFIESWIGYIPEELESIKDLEGTFDWYTRPELMEAFEDLHKMFRNIMRRALKEEAWMSLPMSVKELKETIKE